MKFDMSKAWNEAVAMVSANREVLLVVAGVFFLLPNLVASFLFADVQAESLANMQAIISGETPDESAIATPSASFIGLGFATFVLQMVGYMALLALYDDRSKPTVGEAIAIGFKSLLPLVGAVILFVFGYIVVVSVLSVAYGGIVAATGSGALATILGLLLVMFFVYVMVKLSLTIAVIVLDGQMNPARALGQSWRLTKGNSLRLFAFYTMLMIVYMIVALLVGGLGGALFGIMTAGSVGLILVALLSGAIGAVFNVLFTGVLASIHRQLSGTADEDFRSAFE